LKREQTGTLLATLDWLLAIYIGIAFTLIFQFKRRKGVLRVFSIQK